MHPVLHASPGALLLGGAASIPPAKMHRHRYHGVLPPNSPLRGADTVYGRDAGDDPSSRTEVAAPNSNIRLPARYLWAMLLARLFESPPLTCPNCGADLRIIAFVADAAPVELVLNHLGEPPREPPIAPARPGAAQSCSARAPACISKAPSSTRPWRPAAE